MQFKDFDRAMRLHFWAPYILYLLVAPQMRAKGGGRIVNISSIGGRIAVPHMSSHIPPANSPSRGFSDAIRAELARDNIYVTTVTPGMMRTGLGRSRQVQRRPRGRIPLVPILSENSVRFDFRRTSGKKNRECLPPGASGPCHAVHRLPRIVANAVFPNI